jgi:hypothetical protein
VIWEVYRVIAFFFGCVGGFALNTFRRYQASHNRADKPDFDALYWAQFFGIALLGGLWALGNDLVRQINPLVALNIGLSIPAIAKAGASESVTRRKRRTN